MHIFSPDAREVCVSGNFDDHLKRCEECLSNEEPSEQTLETLIFHSKALVSLVTQELPSIPTACDSDVCKELPARFGPYLSAVVEQRLFEKLLIWVEGKPCPATDKAFRLRDILRAHLLTLFEDLMTQSLQYVLYETSILRPLLQFIFKLSSQLRPDYEQPYGRTLYELCVLLCRDSALLTVCRNLSNELFDQPYLIFTLLVPLIHRADSVGDFAKDAFLLALSLSRVDESLGKYLAFQSDFCPVLAAGLGALYSSLPKKLVPRHCFKSSDTESPGGPVIVTTSAFINPNSSTPCIVELPVGGAAWHQLSDGECNQSVDLRQFLHTLDFCNLVMKISHPSVREQLLYFINSGFLIPVLGSALHQSALDEVVAATAYLELFLRRLTDPFLLKLFLRFIVTASYDSYPILTSLINRLNANAAVVTDVMYQLGMVTLSLFRTILSFHCEDVMYELVFKHLGPLYHIQTQAAQHRKCSTQEDMHLVNSRWLSPPRQDPVIGAQHPPLNELVLGLVRSGDNFLSLATTAAPDLRNAGKGSEAYARYLLAVHRNGDSLLQTPISQAAGTRSGTSPTQTQEVDNRNTSGCSSNSQEGDWVLVNSVRASFTAPETPFLYPYVRSALSRIRRRAAACHDWTSKYFPPGLTDQVTNALQSDKELEEYELRNQLELQTTPTKFTNRPFDRPALSRGSSVENRAGEDLVFSPLTHRSRGRASSLYQLNYISDLSDEESVFESGNSEANDFSADSPVVLGNTTRNPPNAPVSSESASKPSAHYLTADEVCTCLSTLPVEYLSFADDPLDSPIETDQLNSFLATLDRVSLPWNCSLHFGHIPPCSTLPPIDSEFFHELDGSDNSTVPQTASRPPDSLPSPDTQTSSCTQVQSPMSSSTHTHTSDSSQLGRSRSPIAGGIGPFLSILLNRLSNLHTNCFFTNLLLTDLVAALAAYPCPLLYNYLLNSIGLSLKSNVNSLYKVLHTVRSQIKANSASVENWHSLVYRARIYLSCGRPYSTDTVIDPDFYSTENSDQRTGSSVSSSTSRSGSSSKRSISIDRSSLRPLHETRTVWLPPSGNITNGENSLLHLDTSTASCRFNSAIDPLALTVRPWTDSNFIMPLFPVDQQTFKKSTKTTIPTGRASFSSPSPLRLTPFWGSNSGLPSGSAAFKQLWPRTAQRLVASPILTSKSRRAPSREQIRSSVDSDSNEDDPPEPEVSWRTRNLVFGSIIFDEFCYELAALCYIHSMHAELFSFIDS